jgi:hypothetical protein
MRDDRQVIAPPLAHAPEQPINVFLDFALSVRPIEPGYMGEVAPGADDLVDDGT